MRPIAASDQAVIAELANDKVIADNALTIIYPQPENWAKEWIDNKLNMNAEKTGLALVIELDGSVIGSLALFNLDKDHHSAEIGYWVGRPYRGQGYIGEAVTASCKYFFRNFELNRITAHVFASNKASQRVVEKLGMTREGLLRQDTYKNGRHVDSILYSLLKEEVIQD